MFLVKYFCTRTKFRDGIKIVDSNGADSFFSTLAENVESISNLKKSSPENIQVKINKLKKFITNNLEIELREMVTEETQNLVNFIKSLDYYGEVTSEALMKYVEKIKEETRTLSIMLAILTYYSSEDKHESLIVETLERLTMAEINSGTLSYICLSKIPAIVGFYSAGISSVMKKKYKLLNKLFMNIRVRTTLHRQESFLSFTSPIGDLHRVFQMMYPQNKWHLPFETKFMQPYMCEIYNESKIIFDEHEMNEYYDIFEFLRTLKHRHLNIRGYFSGMFGFKEDRSHIEHFLRQGAEEQEDWNVLEIFGHNTISFSESLEKLTEDLNKQSYFNGHQLLSSYPTVIKSDSL